MLVELEREWPPARLDTVLLRVGRSGVLLLADRSGVALFRGGRSDGVWLRVRSDTVLLLLGRSDVVLLLVALSAVDGREDTRVVDERGGSPEGLGAA